MSATAIRYQLAAMLLFVAALLLVHPNAEVGMNDDWSFVRTTYDLAASGQLRYNGWSSPLIGFQACWGALFIKLLGFSFLKVRLSAWILTLGSIPVFWNLFRMLDLSEVQSFFALVLFLLSPLNLPNLTTFMTDMPAFELFAAALLCALKAWGSERERRAMLWTAATTVCGILSGSVRQIYWLSGICFLGVLAFTRLRSMRGRLFILGCMAVTLAVGGAASHWLAQQPYVPADTTLEILSGLSRREIVTTAGTYMIRYGVGLVLLLIPVSVLFTGTAIKSIPVWVQFLVLGSAVGVVFQLPRPFPWLGNTLTQEGVLLAHTVSAGHKPTVLAPWLILMLGWVAIATAAYTLPFWIRTAHGRFAALSAPFLVLYLAVLAYRGAAFGVYDRYLIPAVFLISTFFLSAYARHSRRVGTVGWIAGGMFALYAIATTHDYFAEASAKLRATEQILAAGHRRDSILSGFEFDSWTQAERTAHINNALVKFPVDAYRQMDDCDGPDEVQMWWRSMTPDVKAHYVVSLTPLDSLKASAFKPVEYWRWLPPLRSRIYVEESPQALTCKPDKDE